MSSALRIGGAGLTADIAPLGARLTSLRARLEDGSWRELTVGVGSDEDYLASSDYQGATIGRVANRIAHGELPLDGAVLRLPTNDRGHTLHGGPEGFDRRVWTVVEHDAGTAVLELVSPDGDQGFPGTVSVRAAFEVAGASLRTTYEAVTDAATPVSLTSHPYFSLVQPVTDHRLRVVASSYLPTDADGVPTGVAPVAGTRHDLRRASLVDPGFDHCWCLDGAGLRTVAELTGGGLTLRLATDQPGLQVYAGGGRVEGVALEAQQLPDAVHHPTWPPIVLRPGETRGWRSVMTITSGPRPSGR